MKGGRFEKETISDIFGISWEGGVMVEEGKGSCTRRTSAHEQIKAHRVKLGKKTDWL